MDKILAFSILSSTPADLSAASGFSTRLSWRTSATGTQKPQQQPEKAPRQDDKAAAERQGSRPAPATTERKARFAPEFDGINCFESIVSF